MNILHIAAHLGGGVGKALATLCRLDSADMQRHFLLLEGPRDTRHVDAIRQTGARISVAPTAAEARRMVDEADIVQIEWWNHPRLYECLCRFDLPPSRTIIWSHISGLFAPYVPSALLTAPHQFLFTSRCSLEGAAVQALDPQVQETIGVINSGFGFERATPLSDAEETARCGAVAYLGTVDFAKLSPLLFDVIDQVAPDRPVAIWGGVDVDGDVAVRAARMVLPGSVTFHGHASDPEAIFRQTGIFLYLLQPQHFGTAENALIEAMSLGCVPLVFDNPAERAIVEHGQTGFIEPNAAAAAERLRWMLRHPEVVRSMGQKAAAAVSATRSGARSSADFAALYGALLKEDKQSIDYAALLGDTPLDWFLSTQPHPFAAPDGTGDGGASKGTWAHFAACFPGDPSLSRLVPQDRSAEGLRAQIST